jgi:alkyl sulfatase BDS1-like metallo-beta-lactamase superfamily hydrolase
LETNIVVGFDISDLNETYSYHIRNGIAQFKQSITENAQITITIESRVLIEVMLGIRNLNQAMEAGKILVDGNLSDLKTFIDLFQRPLQPTK